MSGADFFNAPKIVTARKRHRCAYCGGEIRPGEKGVLFESGMWERSFFRRYACSRCQPLVREFWGWQGRESENLECDFDEFLRYEHPELLVTDDDE